MLKSLASVGLMVALGALAVNATISVTVDQHRQVGAAAPSETVALAVSNVAASAPSPVQVEQPNQFLRARKPIPKVAPEKIVVDERSTGRLIVKFRDQLKARPAGGKRLNSLVQHDLGAAERILEEEGGRFAPLFEQSFEELRTLERRAEDASGIAQPDLAGMMYVEGVNDQAALQRIGRRLVQLDIVEFVEVEIPAVPARWLAEGIPDGFFAVQREAAQRVAERRNPDAQPDVFHQQVNQAFGLTTSEVRRLEVPDGIPEVAEFTVPVQGLPATLRLWRHSVRSPDFQMLVAQPDGSLVPMDLGPERTYRGELLGFPGSEVAATILPGRQMAAVVVLPGGDQYYIEPVNLRMDEADPDWHVAYWCEDSEKPMGTCGTGPLHDQMPPAVRAALEEKAQQYANGTIVGGFGGCYAEIALDLDWPWVEEFQSLGIAGLLATNIINAVNVQYERDVEISHVLTTIIARPNASADPYTTTNPDDLLDEFRAYWLANHTDPNDVNPDVDHIRRDIAHLLTGRELDGSVIGLAWLGAICNPQLGFGLSQHYTPFGCQTDLVAHELGHNWGAIHCACEGVTPDENWTMNPSITCANKFNEEGTIPAIMAFRNSIASQCLDDCAGTEPDDGGCGLTLNDCTTVSADPYCSETVCCGAVCAVDPTCCSDAWDQDCVDLANALCFGCGDAEAGNCLTPNNTPGCDDGICCQTVINLPLPVSAFCDNLPEEIGATCEFVWDEKCAILARFCCPGIDTSGPTPDLTAFQGYLTATPTPGFEVLTSFILGEEFRGEGYDMQEMYRLGEELVELGIGEESLARGKGTRVGVVEGAFYPAHEDLSVIQEPGQTMWLNELVTQPSHGTAVLGIINAQENGFGMTGMSPDAQAYFFPTFSLENGGRLTSAIASAMQTLGAGDVLNFSIYFPTGPEGFECEDGSQYITARESVYLLIQMGTQLGISSVIIAGNRCCDLTGTSEAGNEDSGAFIISAVDPGAPFCRRAFSNWTSVPNGDPPHFSGWGDAVATTGGDAELWSDATDGGVQSRSYTARFGGTSAAAPQIAALVANIQGIARQFYGVSLQPTQIRDNSTVTPQCLLAPIPPPQDLDGFCDDPEINPDGACEGDWRFQIPPEGVPCPGPVDMECCGTPAYVAGIPIASAWAIDIIEAEYFADTQFVEIHTIRGEYIAGNEFAVRHFDGIHYRAESETTGLSAGPSTIPPGFEGPMSQVVYRRPGQIADIFAVAESEFQFLTGLQVTAVTGPIPAPTVAFLELYEFQLGQWIAASAGYAGPGGQIGMVTPAGLMFDPNRFVNQDDNTILVRVVFYGYPPPAGPGGLPEEVTYEYLLDLLTITMDGSGIGD